MLHSGLVASQSKALETLINGKLKEAKESRVEWPFVSNETFLLFSNFLYTGKYWASYFHATSYQPPTTPGNPEKQVLRHICCVQTFRCSSPEELRLSQSGGPSVGGVLNLFLVHFRMYIFADCYGIVQLMDASSAKLTEALKRYKSCKHEWIDLLVVCATEDIPQKLEKLVLDFVASQILSVWLMPRFQQVLRDHEALNWPLMNHVMASLHRMPLVEEGDSMLSACEELPEPVVDAEHQGGKS